MVAKIEIKGAAETAHAFDALRNDLADMAPAHEKIARARLPGVRQRTPVRSGALASSWDAEGSPDGGGILSPLPYAGPIEFGSSARNIIGVGMIAATLEAEAADVTAEYGEAIAERARARGFPRD